MNYNDTQLKQALAKMSECAIAKMIYSPSWQQHVVALAKVKGVAIV